MLRAILEAYIEASPHRSFNPSPQNIVFGEGDPDAELMFVGEAPGAEEDATGRPFVGRAGQLLEKMIVSMGLTREKVYIANVLKARPPGNATPTPEQAEASAPFLYAQIAAIRPRVIVTLGLPASKLLVGSAEPMARLRSVWHPLRLAPVVPQGFEAMAEQALEVEIMPTYHPAYLLRSYTTENRAKVWSDLQMVMKRLGLAGAKSQPQSPA